MPTPSVKSARARFDQWFLAYSPVKQTGSGVTEEVPGSIPVADVLIRYFAVHPDQQVFRKVLLKHLNERATEGNVYVDVSWWR